MSILQKALLQEVSADRHERTIGTPVPVQFNPTSLKLKLSNQTEGGRSRARQRRQHSGSSSTVLTLELVFDSADEGTTDVPVSVREKTAIVEKYVVPKRGGSETPPKLRFEWNELIITGIVESVDIDFDLFASDGTPLRAKVSLSIKEQEPSYQFLETGAGVRDNAAAVLPGQGAAGAAPGAGTNDPGASPANSDRSASALEGETAPEFAARLGLDPSAWRGLDIDLTAGLSLEAGIEVGFSAGLSLNAGVGVSLGVQAGVDLSLGAAVGLEASIALTGRISVAAGASGDSAAGFALSGAGGVVAAIETVKIANSQAAVEETLQAFSTPVSVPAQAASATAVVAQSSSSSDLSRALVSSELGNSASARSIGHQEQARKPLLTGEVPSYSEQEAALSAPLPPTADPRAVSYGSGAPLRPLYKLAQEQGQTRICAGSTQARRGEGEPEFRKVPTIAPWVQLPVRDPGRSKADAAEVERRAHPCGYLYSNKREGGMQ